jgi:hypothetical protein
MAKIMKGIITTVLAAAVVIAPTYQVTSTICSKVKCDGIETVSQKYQQAFQNDIRRMGIK